MKKLLMPALLLVISTSYAVSNRQIFLMHTQTSELNSENHQYGQRRSDNRSSGISQTYRVQNAQGKVVGTFKSSNARQAQGKIESYCNTLHSGFNSSEACMAAQRAGSNQGPYKATQYKPMKYQAPKYESPQEYHARRMQEERQAREEPRLPVQVNTNEQRY